MLTSFKNHIKKYFENSITAIKNDVSNFHKTSLSVALGVLIGTSPLLGFHSLTSIVLASIFRLNKTIVLSFSVLIFPLFLILLVPEIIIGAQISGIDNGNILELVRLVKYSGQEMSINLISNWQILKIMIHSLGLAFYNIVLGWLILGLASSISSYFFLFFLLKHQRFTKKSDKH